MENRLQLSFGDLGGGSRGQERWEQRFEPRGGMERDLGACVRCRAQEEEVPSSFCSHGCP